MRSALLQDLDPVGGETARELGSAFYPSGHAAAAMALSLATAVVLRHHPWPYLLLIGGTWCSIHGFIRFATGSHHISDVIGGFLLGFAVAATSCCGLARPADWTRAPDTGVIAAGMAAELARRKRSVSTVRVLG